MAQLLHLQRQLLLPLACGDVALVLGALIAHPKVGAPPSLLSCVELDTKDSVSTRIIFISLSMSSPRGGSLAVSPPVMGRLCPLGRVSQEMLILRGAAQGTVGGKCDPPLTYTYDHPPPHTKSFNHLCP